MINNVGSIIAADGYGRDRGWLEVDAGPVRRARRRRRVVRRRPCCLRRAYLDDVGLFDERLFLYYEDVELSLRGAQRGWRYRTAPDLGRAPRARRHIGRRLAPSRTTTTSGTGLLDGHPPRGGPARRARPSLAISSLTASYADARRRRAPAARRPRQPEIVRRRLRAFGAYVARSPDASRARRSDASAQVVPGPADSGKSMTRARIRTLRVSSPVLAALEVAHRNAQSSTRAPRRPHIACAIGSPIITC